MEDLKSIPVEKRRIDVWWCGDATGKLMLLLAYLMTRNEDWKEAKIRVLAACFTPESDKTVEDLRKLLEEVRIEAEPEVVIKPNSEAVADYSSDALLVYIPFRFQGDQPIDPFGGRTEDILPRLSNVAMVLAAEDIELDAEPEEGTAGDTAAILDALTDAQKRAEEAEKAAERASEIADNKLQEIQKAVSSQTDAEDISKLESELEEAKQLAVDAKGKAVEARAKVGAASKTAEAAGAELPKSEEK